MVDSGWGNAEDSADGLEVAEPAVLVGGSSASGYAGSPVQQAPAPVHDPEVHVVAARELEPQSYEAGSKSGDREGFGGYGVFSEMPADSEAHQWSGRLEVLRPPESISHEVTQRPHNLAHAQPVDSEASRLPYGVLAGQAMASRLAPWLRRGHGFHRLQPGPRSFGAFRASRALSAARDAYTVMGLDRRASQQEIKERFRVLAKQYHPDLNTGDRTASLKMAELTSAYDTLMDPKKRAALDQATAGTSAGAGPGSSYTGGFPYDDSDGWVSPSQMFSEFSDLFGRNSQFRPNMDASAAQRGEDVSTGLDVSFLEAAQGCEKVVSLRLKQVCQDCHGTGAREGTTWSKCRVCRGTGVLRQEKGIFSMGLPCQRCRGSGMVLDHPCRTCRGESTVMMTRDIRINVPAGVRNLMELRVPGAGHAGSRGGKAGHLFVQVKVLPHERFRQVDDDVHLDVRLTLREALLGAEVSIPNLEGSTERLIIQAPAQPGTTKVLRGRGPPKPGNQGRGHLVLHFLLHLPRSLSPRQVELIEEFDSLAEVRSAAGRGSPRTPKSSARAHLSSSALASRESSRASQGGLLRGEDSGNDGHRAWSEQGESDAKDLDVIAKTRQRVREVRERERLERLREEEEKEQRKKDAQAQHEERLRRQEHEKRQRLLERRVEQESKMAKEAEEKRHDQERRRQQEERAKSLQRQMQARIKAEKELAAKEKRELEQHEKEQRRRTEEEAAKRAAEATEAAKRRLAERKKQQDKLRKDEEEASQRTESRESSRNPRDLSAQAAPRPRGDSVEAVARRRAEERVRHRSQERRKEEERIRAREALQKCEVEEELRRAKEELEERRRSAALRAASRSRREKETEERLRQERDEQTAATKERRLLYRNPKAIAELKASEPQMPLTSEQRRSHSRRRQAEQEKLQRYAEGLPVEDSGRPPPLPGAAGAAGAGRRGSRPKAERSNGNANRLSPSSSLTEQTGCSETESVLEPLEEPSDEHGEPKSEPFWPGPTAEDQSKALPEPPVSVTQLEAQEANDVVTPVAELPLTGLPVGKVSGQEGREVKEDVLEVSQVPEELAQEPVEEPLEPDELEEVEVESNLSISLHIRI
ncbi:dnaJ [Symbiodinium microadriaticum]|nr:dnaJ [Symbiodinium sp. KB8]CAE7865503.1 dnaJ [Symbiodinium microadriaticum]